MSRSRDDELVGRPDEDVRPRPEHPVERVAQKTGRSEDLIRSFVRAIERKGQAVLYGPPGTGKSFLARELARHLVGGGDGFTRQLVLHASTSYEDFVQGYRPVMRADGTVQWPLVRGRVVLFAEERRDELHAVGMSQGVLPVRVDPSGTPMVLPGGDGLSLVAPGHGGLRAGTAALSAPRALPGLLDEVRALVAEVHGAR